MKIILVALDFDHTVVDENTDVKVVELSPNGIPPEIHQLRRTQNWTRMMDAFFGHLFQNGIREDDIRTNMSQIKCAPGMEDLLKFCGSHPSIETVIVSDANTVFIDNILAANDLSACVDKVYSNPAHYDEDGRLHVDFYHHQDWCKRSSINMCKGYIVEEHLATLKDRGDQVSCTVYVGDGSNDFCPATKLAASDIVCGRETYRLHEMLSSASPEEVTARKLIYSCASQIKAAIQERLS